MLKDPPPVSFPLSKTSTIIQSVGGRGNSHIRIFHLNREKTPYRLSSFSSTSISPPSQLTSHRHTSAPLLMEYIHPNIYRETHKRLAYLTLDIGELDLEILDGLKSTADAAIGLAGGYDADTGDLCALAISTQKRILILSFNDSTVTDAPSMLASSILLNPSIKKYAFSAPRLITSLPAVLPSLRSKEVYDLIPKGRYRPHTMSAITNVLGSSAIDEENVIEVFSSDICDMEDHKHIFNLAMRAWAACHVVNKKGPAPTFRVVLPYDTVSLTDDVCCSASL